MRKLIQTLWLPLIFLILPLEVNAQNWVSLSTPQYNAYRVNFVDRYTGFITGLYGGTSFIMTANGGLTWSTVYLSESHVPINVVTKFNNKLYAGAGGEFLGFEYGAFYSSDNGGNNWTGITTWGCSFLDLEFLDGNTIIAGTGLTYSFETDGGIFRSTNGGLNWTSTFHDFHKYECVDFPNVTTGFAMGNHWADFGYSHHKVIKTTNGGLNWFAVKKDSTLDTFPLYKKIQFLNPNTGYLLYTNLFKTTNGGSSWYEPYPFDDESCRSFHFINTETGWASGYLNGKVYKTTNGGSNWEEENIPVPNVAGEIFFLDETHGWARATSGIVLTTDTTGLLGITNGGTSLPEQFKLHQNYPNPFNPTTKIKFEIPKQGFVKLSVFDIAGREIAVLVNDELKHGVYEYSFDGSGLSSGVYFYKLQSGEFVETQRMVLVK